MNCSLTNLSFVHKKFKLSHTYAHLNKYTAYFYLKM